MKVTTRTYQSEIERQNLKPFGEACDKNNKKCTTIGNEIYMEMFKSQYSESESESENESESESEWEEPEVILERMLKEIREETKSTQLKNKINEQHFIKSITKQNSNKQTKYNYNVIILTNIKGDINVGDVYDIFSTYGNIEHIYINQYADPICFIRYYKKRDAKIAIEKLNDYRCQAGKFMLEYMPI